ncbi:MAG: ABC transporter ATP-binding protein, partial [Actinobacteria bacterium]|nr:ABC transporter ATP-binding protein [Actinomycetota bacterium]
MAGTPIIELRGVNAGYGAIDILHDIDLAVEPGEVLVVLGANGAGKTTLTRVIAGELAPRRGDLFIGGRRMNGARPHALARAGVCTIPEGRGVFPNLTVAENLLMMTHRGRSRREVESIAYDAFPRLAERRDQLAGTMSGGEQQMLALARALTTRPGVLIVDELSMGLAPLVVRELFSTLERLAADGLSILIVEQFADLALDMAHRAVVLA